MTKTTMFGAAVLGVLLQTGCGPGPEPECAPDNAGLALPEGFCALIVADEIGRARHLTAAPNGDLFVAVASRPEDQPGGVLALRDTDGDGVADVTRFFGEGRGSDVKLHAGFLYFSNRTAVMRYGWSEGQLEPNGDPEVIVRDLPGQRGHWAKSLAFGAGNSMYVNIGSRSNSCQLEERGDQSPGHDPCTELEGQAGIWEFDASRPEQTQSDGRRFATGLRNTVALAVRSDDGALYGVVHGRDRLAQNWGNLFTEQQSAEKPAEEFVRIADGDDFGWPYCYYDPELERKVLAPEYGGDGQQQGRCSDKKDPLVGFPGHWAPNGLLFYSGNHFPDRYRGGAFIVFHGSWNRAPLPQGGYNVVFQPFDGRDPAGSWEVFAEGFAGEEPTPGSLHRPVDIAEGPDGSLFVSDDRGGRIYRILYTGD
jgi:glucose/arabinose dehydrogenase